MIIPFLWMTKVKDINNCNVTDTENNTTPFFIV